LDTEIVKVGLNLENIIGRGLNARNTGGVLLPEIRGVA